MTMNEHLPRPTVRRWTSACIAASLLASPVLHAQTAPEIAGHSPALKSRQQVTLNFVNADIEAVTRAIGAMLDRQFVVDPRVKGQITVYSEQPMTVREAYLNYLAALRGLGFTVVENAGLLKVVPEADAKLQAGTVSVGPVVARGDQIITQIFRLNHENPNNLVAVLRPLISPNNTINANATNNTLVITDYADNLQRLAKIIAALDQPAATDIEVVPLEHAVASDIAPIVLRLADGGVAVPGVPAAAGGASVLADSRSNSLIIRAASPSRLAQMRSVIQKLDRPQQRGSGPAGNIWVVYLKNADATKLATVLRAAFGGGGGGAAPAPAAGISGVPTSGSALGGSVTTLGVTGGGGTAQTPATAPVSASAGPSTGGFIQADPSTNSLIITAPEPLYRQLRAVIDQLDARRAQVYVESMIVKLDATKAAEFGFQWQNIWGKPGDRTAVGAGTNFNTGTSRAGNILDLTAAVSGGVSTAAEADLSQVPNGLNIGFAKKIGPFWTLGALAKFLESETGANVLSTPNIVALDNEEAKIVVGRNVPFITGQFTGTGTAVTSPFQTIERKDVGLTLRIKSQIGEGGTIRMTIFQENSNVIQQTLAGTAGAGPSTDKSSIETTVVVDDGQVIVLGGLLRDEYDDGENRVPGLGKIPLLGHLFRNENRSRTKSNLMVFLRPVVLRNQPQADALTMDRYEAIRAQQINSQPKPSLVVPVNEAPVLPPLPPPSAQPVPVSPPPPSAPAPLPESTTAPPKPARN
jgi:general secretion pathway protein D